MSTFLIYLMLIAISAVAKIEELVSPGLLMAEKVWLINYRFDSQNQWFCRLCRKIPTSCPAERIGLPPMCKLNPLYDQMMILQLKASDIEHQDTWIEMAKAEL